MENPMKTITLKQIPEAVEESRDNQKYCIFFDKNGQCGTYFNYHGARVEIHKMIIRAVL